MGSESPVYKLLAGVVEGQGLCWLLGIVQLFSTLSTVVRQALLSMEFSRQEYWSGLSLPSPENLPNPGIKLGSPHCRQTLYRLSH